MARIYKDKRSLIVQNAFVDFRTGALLSPVETESYTVVQVASSHYIGGFETNAHRQHCDLELTLPVTGALFSTADECEARVERGAAYFSFRGEYHRLYARSSCRFFTLALNFKAAARPLFDALAARFCTCRTKKEADPAALMPRIAAEFSGERRPFFEPMLNALIGELLIPLARPEESTYTAIEAEDALCEMINYMDCHYLSIISPEELARFGYSYHYLCARFKSVYGTTPGAYLFSRRMDHAARLLAEGKSVSAVSLSLGYSSPYNFSRAFKKHTGKPPSAYIKK